MMKVRMVRISQFGWAGVLGPEDVKKSLCEDARLSGSRCSRAKLQKRLSDPIGPSGFRYARSLEVTEFCASRLARTNLVQGTSADYDG